MDVVVHYTRKTDAFRALGRLLGESGYRPAIARGFSEAARFNLLGGDDRLPTQWRTGVPVTIKALMRRCALMGINTFILYTEDTYEVPGEPFFGYLRGRYTQEELRDLDAYADTLGIEMFLSIQTLGHLGQILQWPAYSRISRCRRGADCRGKEDL